MNGKFECQLPLGLSDPHDDLYTCDCTMGYTGQNCQDKKDFCVEFNQPCRNNATCTSIDAGFVSLSPLFYSIVQVSIKDSFVTYVHANLVVDSEAAKAYGG